MDVVIKNVKISKRRIRDPRVRWWSLTMKNVAKLVEKVKAKRSWKQVGDAYTIWDAMAECIDGPPRRS